MVPLYHGGSLYECTSLYQVKPFSQYDFCKSPNEQIVISHQSFDDVNGASKSLYAHLFWDDVWLSKRVIAVNPSVPDPEILL
ncbi:hypothetical protein E2C01_043251 [Portunus trituberculatus]|uniref:Uncharacterized protein n=1 Tax=Portunus trituberculatus TaxID=210409 RepID=A0A5B7FVT6_PORTR|nr:hypothetical protein [Portunus trituberculatus]